MSKEFEVVVLLPIRVTVLARDRLAARQKGIQAVNYRYKDVSDVAATTVTETREVLPADENHRD